MPHPKPKRPRPKRPRPKRQPSKTKKQKGLMKLCSTSGGRRKARVKCPPKKVAREFARADRKSKV